MLKQKWLVNTINFSDIHASLKIAIVEKNNPVLLAGNLIVGNKQIQRESDILIIEECNSIDKDININIKDALTQLPRGLDQNIVFIQVAHGVNYQIKSIMKKYSGSPHNIIIFDGSSYHLLRDLSM